VTTCSIFCPTPSLASMVVNHFGMRPDMQSYHLGGMGCSNGVVAVNLVKDLLRVSRERTKICMRHCLQRCGPHARCPLWHGKRELRHGEAEAAR
jgi:predicted naringenin-chalcone synthase